MKVLICGGREWWNKWAIRSYLLNLPKDTVIIEGECRGADIIARKEAKKLGMVVEDYPAKWDDLTAKPCFIKYRNGKPYNALAGHIRNQEMLDKGKPDQVVAFHDNFNDSKGTKNMIERAEKAGIATTIFSSQSNENKKEE